MALGQEGGAAINFERVYSSAFSPDITPPTLRFASLRTVPSKSEALPGVTMRLRLTVRRNALPETPVVWNVDSDTSTISQLLEQVNEAIPIESGEWGFEDYAVELKGSNGVNFECLHWQPVGKVFKEDDEVMWVMIYNMMGTIGTDFCSIRPLLTHDLKIRKISGRHQISSDGKHLVDGLAFGRPLLRRPADRPVVNIPPRKRRRVTYNEDEDDDEGALALKEKEEADTESENEESSNNRQLVLHAEFDDDDSEDDEDFAPGEGEEDKEKSDVDADTDTGDDSEEAESADEQSDEKQEDQESDSQEEDEEDSDEPALQGIHNKATQVSIRKLHSAFPKSTPAVCKYVLEGTDGDVGEAYEALTRGFVPMKSKGSITETSQESRILAVPKTRSKARPSIKEELNDSMQVEPDESADSVIGFYDHHGLPQGSISSGKALSVMADALNRSPSRPRPSSRSSVISNKSVKFSEDGSLSNGLTSTPFIDKESELQSTEENSDDSSDETSSSGSDSSFTNEDSDKVDVTEASTSDSDSDSSSDSSSDDEPTEETSSKPSSTISATSKKGISSSAKDKPESTMKVTPGQGKKSTRERNLRRKNANALHRYKEKGILPAGTTLSEFSQLKLSPDVSCEDASTALDKVRSRKISEQMTETTGRALAKVEEFEARREELLSSIASGGVDVDRELVTKASKSSSMVREEQIDSQPSSSARGPLFDSAPEVDEPTPNLEGQQPTITESKNLQPLPEAATDISAPSKPTTPSAESAKSNPAPARRAKLDVGAGRRLLFGALGLKNPKTKKDEDKLRNDLMKDVRPLVTPKPADDTLEAIEESEDPNAWRDKVIYRAVECCQEGVELSEPPFPFVQRWDSQQQYIGPKRKRKLRDKGQHYEEKRPSKKQRQQRKGKHSYAEEQEYLNDSYEPSDQHYSMDASYGEPTQDSIVPEGIEDEIDDQLMHDLQEDASAGVSQGPENLAPLPEDPSILPDLKVGQTVAGMTIAFKQLDMSEATRWQPQISAYRTAIVIATPEGGELQLTLALRDRKQIEKCYDEETGQRIYNKFEMPEDDDQQNEGLEDDGMLNITFDELIEPKIVQNAPADLVADSPEDNGSQAKVDHTTENSITLSHEDESAEVQLSHVTETPLQSDVPEPKVSEQEKQLNPEESVENETNQEPSYQEESIPQDSIQHEPNQQESINEESNPEQLSIQEESKSLAIESNMTVENQNLSDLDNVVEPQEESNLPEQASELPKHLTDADSGKATNTPSRIQSTPHVEMDLLTDSVLVSEEARQQISRLMKDAGFRSSVPSSVIRDIRLDGMESPGEVAVFERLRKEMAEINSDPPYSPKFNGIGSSPSRNTRQSSGPPSESVRQASTSPSKPQSSWQAIGFQEPSSPPVMAEPEEKQIEVEEEPQASDQDEGSWETMGPETASSLHVKKSKKRNSKLHKLLKGKGIGEAQRMWEALQPKKQKEPPSMDAQTPKQSPRTELPFALDGVDEKGETVVVEYPKLSTGSSFTSQISDHGRQPDIAFDDSALLNDDAPKGPNFEDDSFRPDDVMTDAEPELPNSANADANGGVASDSEPKLPSRRAVNGSSRVRGISPALSTDGSSPLLPLYEALSQPDVKREKSASISSRGTAKISKEYNKKKAALDEDSEEEDQTTPKASQRWARPSRQISASQPISQPSRPKALQPRASQVSQVVDRDAVVDLTQSSDAEPDDDYAEPDVGWVRKRASSQAETWRNVGGTNGLRASSQTSLPARNSRRSRF